MLQMGKILVPVDFSPCSKLALDYAAFLGQRFGAELEALHVWEPPRYVIPEVTVQVPGEPQRTLMEFARSEAGKEMEGFLAALEGDDQPKVTGRLESGDPKQAILELTSNGGYDLVVMGTHGRTGLTHLFLGSVAEKVVQRATCPVLTIRSPKQGEEQRP